VTHLDEDRLQRLVDGESEPDRGHLAACSACRERLAQAEREEREIERLLATLDSPPPAADLGVITARARARQAAIPRWAAAAALLAILAGAAVAIPGSPFKAWVSSMVEQVRREAPVRSEPQPSGVAVAPGERLDIVFAAASTARVTLSEGTEVVVRARPGSAAFAVEKGRILVRDGDTLDFEIEIPRSAPRVEVFLGPRSVFLKEGDDIRTDATQDASGAYLLSLKN
jgi:anti-sigma factor RsiW